MQGTQDMTLDSEQSIATSSRTTAAGLEAWLSGAHTEEVALADTTADSRPQPVEIEAKASIAAVAEPIAATVAEPMAEVMPQPVEAIPVNAAEALAWSLAQGTFSSARKLVGPDGAELVVDPEKNAYHFESTSLKPLAALLEQPASAWTPIYSEAMKTARAANPAQPLERLRWYAGLIATPGILNRKLSREERYKLSRWPETEREFPKHFRIAKEMVKEAATVDAIAASAGVTYEEVVDYVNASYASGRLEAASAANAVEAPAPSRRKRLLARLNKPLFAR